MRVVTNSTDRRIRLFTLPSAYLTPPVLDEAGLPAEGGLGEYVHLEQDLEATHSFSDSISRSTWMRMTFSQDEEIWAGEMLYGVLRRRRRKCGRRGRGPVREGPDY